MALKSVLRLTLAEAAKPLIVAAAFTSTWTGIDVGGLQLVDLFLALTAPLLLIDAYSAKRGKLLPRWISIPAAVVIIVVVVQQFFPASTSYLNNRFILTGGYDFASEPVDAGLPLLTAAKWLVALAILPLIVSYMAQGDPSLLPTISTAWLFGASVSAIFAMADYFGITQIGAALLGGVNASGRQSGLASHPNNLGVACAIAVPVAMWLFTRHPRIGFLSVAVLLVGAFVTGSRGAQAGAALAVVLTLILVRETRRIFVWIAAGLVLGGFLLITFAPDVVSSALQLLRFLDPSTGADASDTGRSALAQQAITDFSYNPAFGVGFEILTNAHSVPLQLLSSGGIVLATAIISLFAGSIRSGWKLRKSIGGLTGALLVSVIVWLAQSVIENQLVDRYLYFPVAIIVALTMHPDLRREQTENHRVTLMPNRSA